jgi:hypothetical protein
MRQIAIVIALSVVAGFFMHLPAQQRVPLVTGPLSAEDKTTPLESEIISVGRLGVWPTTITRHAGKFILILHNRGADPKSVFTIEAVAAPGSTAQVSATPVVRFDLTRVPAGLLGGAINPPVGQYQLKSLTTGQVLCQLTIN